MKLIFLFFSIFVAFNATAQNKTPVTVQKAFTQLFPEVTAKKWDKENDNYEANFMYEGKTMSATFSAAGSWLETETDIAVSTLPAAVTAYIKLHFNNAIIKGAAFLHKPGGDMYEAEIKGKDVLFTLKGDYIKTLKD